MKLKSKVRNYDSSLYIGTTSYRYHTRDAYESYIRLLQGDLDRLSAANEKLKSDNADLREMLKPYENFMFYAGKPPSVDKLKREIKRHEENARHYYLAWRSALKYIGIMQQQMVPTPSGDERSSP